MVDPEDLYGKLVSGNSSAVRGQADVIGDAMKKVNESSVRVDEAADRPKWTSAASAGYRVRTAGVSRGIQLNYFVLGRIQTSLRTGALAYDAMTGNAEVVIKHWRDRPANLGPVLEPFLALAVHLQLVDISANYNTSLAAVAKFASGEEIDPDSLDAQTRAWLESGDDKTEEWLAENGLTRGDLGPIIPNLGVSGDDRGLIPQGLGYDPETGLLLSTSYRKDGGPSTLSMVDPNTGEEVADVELGGYSNPWDRTPVGPQTPDHAGGVGTHGPYTYVTSSGNPSHLFKYRTSDLQNGSNNGPVSPVEPPMELPAGAGAYATIRDGELYVGTHTGEIGPGGNDYDGADDDGRLYRYTLDGNGDWTADSDFGGGAGYVHTPPQAQGVIVRDGEYVFSTSLGRDNQGRLIVQDRQDGESGNGDRGDPYMLPNMSEGLIELDGNILTTYESAADFYGPDGSDDEDLWANPHMTETSLAELGLSEDDVDVSPETLRSASADLDTAAGPLTGAANFAGSVTVVAANFGEVAAATTLSTAVNAQLNQAERSLDTGARAVHRTSATLAGNARIYTDIDDSVADRLGRGHGL